MGRKHLETIWSADTEAGHELRILHRDVPVDDLDDARAKHTLVARAFLHGDGLLTCTMNDGTVVVIAHADVAIDVYKRPPETRGERFIPDTTTDEGLLRVRNTMTDPRYQADDDDYAPVEMKLEDLARVAGGAGHLSSVAYGAR